MRKIHFFRLSLICIWSIAISMAFSYPLMAHEREINNLSGALAWDIASAGKKTVAVVDFTDLQGNVTELGRFLAEEFSVALAGADLAGADKGFEVIDRTHLRTILAEHKLSATGIIDPQTARELGKIAGVDALITGTITPFGESVRILVKILDSETARIIGASGENIAKTQVIEELLARGIETGVAPATPTPARPKPPAVAQQSVEVKGLLFQLDGCKVSGQTATCSFLITNKEVDRTVGLRAGTREYFSRLFDDFGYEYRANRARMANASGEEWVQSVLVSGVPTRAVISFGGISPQASRATLLEIKFRQLTSRGWDDITIVQFRNIPLSR